MDPLCKFVYNSKLLIRLSKAGVIYLIRFFTIPTMRIAVSVTTTKRPVMSSYADASIMIILAQPKHNERAYALVNQKAHSN
jgi:hypothetical protein